MTKYSALFAVLSLSLLVNGLNHTTTLTSHATSGVSTVFHTHFGENVQESESLTTIGNYTTEAVGIPYNDAHIVTTTYCPSQSSNYTFVESLAGSSSELGSNTLSSSSHEPTIITTTRKHTGYTVSNSVFSTSSTISDGQATEVVQTSQSRIPVTTSTQIATVTTKLSKLPTNAAVTITTTASTSTTTIFTASTTPSSTFEGSTASSSYTSGQDPLFSNTQSTVEQSTTIGTISLTKDVTITVSTSSTSTIATSSSASTGGVSSNSTNTSHTLSSSSGGYFNTTSISVGSSSGIISSLNSSSLSVSSLSINSSTTELSLTSLDSSVTSILSSVTSSVSSSSSTPSSSSASSSVAPVSSVASSASSSSSSTSTLETTSATSVQGSFDLFSVVSTDAPPSVFPREDLPLQVLDGVTNDGKPFETNKFYANLFLGNQEDPVWTYPYGMFKFTNDYYGLAVSHTTSSQYVFGNYNSKGVAEYYFSPAGLAPIIFSAKSFTKDTFSMDISEMEAMSVLVTLFDKNNSPASNFIDLQLVQGMGFVTATYNGGLTPLLNSNVGFSKLIKESSDALSSNVLKYKATLYNNVDWLIYVTLPNGNDEFSLSVNGGNAIEGSSSIDGLIIQVAVAPSSDEAYYDEAAGIYVTDANVEGSSNGQSASYKFKYTTKGESSSGSPIVFALPHHLKSMTSSTSQRSTGISLDSTTKGKMYAYLTNELQFQDDFHTQVEWLPWSQQMNKDLSYTTEQLQLLASVANDDLAVDFTSSTKGLTTYYAGKYLDKYAYILLVIDSIIQDESVRNSTLERLKDAFDTFLDNEQLFPLMYDTRYGGVTSTAAQNGDTGADFGGSYYNDHHFHYGYFIHAAAVIGMVDAKLGGSWAQDHKDWVNSLVRDVANPSKSDTHFPVSRMFDWYAGHSWAAGLFAAADGKNEESTSEDYNFAYGMKLWGKVIGDSSMEARGDLMISIMAKSMNDYFLYSDDNDVEPEQIIGNKVSGILFDNKIDHTTWFGTNTEYIHGIHMLPVTPISSVVRGPTFVSQEWSQVISPIIDSLNSGWTGILRLNQALTDPKSSYNFFSQDNFSSAWLDNGLSRTWCLAFSGGLANAV